MVGRKEGISLMGKKVQDFLVEWCGFTAASHSYCEQEIVRNKNKQPDQCHIIEGLKMLGYLFV